MTLAPARPPRKSDISGPKPKVAVVQFPGSNCDQDAYHVLRDVLECPVEYVWHQTASLKGFDIAILPGGFSYGDYLRTGAVARFAPVMEAVRAHAESGGFVLGICNGFQVLCEAHLLPGALVRNAECKFLCKWVSLRVEQADSAFTSGYKAGQLLRIPIAHGEGRYVCDEATLRELETNRQILFRYADANGGVTSEHSVNGSVANIAGIQNAAGNVLGLMPHPERAAEKILGSADGRILFESLLRAAQARM